MEVMNELPPGILTVEEIEALHARWRRSEKLLNRILQTLSAERSPRALRDLQVLLVSDPDYPLGHFQLGRALFDAGDLLRAAEHLLIALELGMTQSAVVELAEQVLRALDADDPRTAPLRERFQKAIVPRNPTLTLAMIVRDEAEHLRDCLESVRAVVDQIVVVDTGSQDGTPEIARELGAEVYFFPWQDDFSAARNESLQYARGDWVLWLDADERLAPESAEPLRALLRREEVAAAHLQIDNEMGGRTVSFLTPRLWRRHPAIRFRQPIHEQVFWAIAPLARRYGRQIVEAPEVRIQHRGYLPSVHMRRRKADRNFELLRRLVERERENAYALFHYAGALREMGRLEEALEAFERWEPLAFAQGDSEQHWLRVGFGSYVGLLCQMDLPERALRLSERAIQKVGETATLRYHRAWALHQLGRHLEALRELERARRIPRDPATHVEAIEFQPLLIPMLTANIYLSLGEPEKAKDQFEEAHELNPQDPRPLIGLARLAVGEENFAAAAELLQKALEAAPEDPHLLAFFGEVEVFRGNLESAQDALHRAHRLSADAEVGRLLADVWFLLGEEERAVRIWKTAPQNERAAGALAFWTMVQGDPYAVRQLADPRVRAGALALAQKILAVHSRRETPAVGRLIQFAQRVGSEPMLGELRNVLLRAFLKYRFREGITALRRTNS